MKRPRPMPRRATLDARDMLATLAFALALLAVGLALMVLLP